MSKRFVITDIHGCFLSFKKLWEDQLKPDAGDMVYFLGDYINKGPGSKQVLDFLMQLQESGSHQVKFLKGNHEQILLDVLRGYADLDEFYDKGGSFTLESFGVKEVGQIPPLYLSFFESLELYYETHDAYLVHAGFNFEYPDPFMDSEAMFTIRSFQVDNSIINNKKIIHGHVPTDLNTITRNFQQQSQVLDIDGGCVYPYREGMGHLIGLELNSWDLYIQPCIDEVIET